MLITIKDEKIFTSYKELKQVLDETNKLIEGRNKLEDDKKKIDEKLKKMSDVINKMKGSLNPKVTKYVAGKYTMTEFEYIANLDIVKDELVATIQDRIENVKIQIRKQDEEVNKVKKSISKKK